MFSLCSVLLPSALYSTVLGSVFTSALFCYKFFTWGFFSSCTNTSSSAPLPQAPALIWPTTPHFLPLVWLLGHFSLIWSRKFGIRNKGLRLYPSRFLSWLEQRRCDLPWPPVPPLPIPQFPIIERIQNNSLSGKEIQGHTHQQSCHQRQRLRSTLFPRFLPCF